MKNLFLPQKTATSQTHFGFTKLGSNIYHFRRGAIWNKKFRFGSPCTIPHLLCTYVTCCLFSIFLFRSCFLLYPLQFCGFFVQKVRLISYIFPSKILPSFVRVPPETNTKYIWFSSVGMKFIKIFCTILRILVRLRLPPKLRRDFVSN